VLELACGTGRVLLPIAQQGLRIDGVDSSPAMLDQLQQKLAREPQHVRELASTSLGDLRSYRSERKYALVIIPFRPLQHMYTVEDQLAALNTAAFHLGSGGLLAFDVFYPRFESLLAGVGEETLLLAGLEVVEEYGSSEKAPLDNDSKEMAFVLQRSSPNREREN
jgi:SAM-dependent methyltransferase